MQKKQIVIDKRTLEVILNDQKSEMEGWTDEFLCSRNEESLVDLGSPQAQVVIGVRRCGKSTLCMQTLAGAGVKFAYADFDDERLDGLDTAQLNDVLEVLYKIYGSFQYIFLDEIQNIEGWPLFVNRLLRNKMHVVLTGSNAKLLSSDLATHLTGRSSEIELYPFSFVEYCKMKGVKKYSPKSKLRVTQEKVYAVDVALMNKRENAFAGDNLGWRLETIVLSHLLRKCKLEGWDVYYLKDRSGECDFVVCDGNKVMQCIQVSYDISSKKTRKREIDGLLLAHRQTKCENLLLLTDHVYEEVDKDGVHMVVKPVYEWCTEMAKE